MSSGEVDLATLAIKVDVTDVRGAIAELDKLEQSAIKLQTKAESLKTFFAGLGQAVNSSYNTIDSTLNSHLASAINKEKTYTTAFDSELKAREVKSLQSSDRRLSQILELQVKISNKERQLQEQSLAAEKAHNDRRIILTAKTLNEIEALERAKAEKANTRTINRSAAVEAYKAETATLLAEFERRVNLEHSVMTRGENTKATIRVRYAQQEEMIRARLANAIKEVTAAMESGLISKTEALAARESILARASEELINTNKQLVSSLHQASDATDLFHRVLSKSLDMLIRMAAYRVISIIASLPGQLYEVNKDFELLQVRLEGVMGSTEAAKLEFQRLIDLDIKTPFDLKSLADADLMLRNFGLALTDDQFKGLTDQIAQLGVGSEGLTGIVTQLGQAWAKNRLQLTDLRPMMERHLPVLDLLAKAYKTDVNSILAMASAGDLGREAILKLFNEMERNAPDAAAKQMHLLSGAMSNITSAWDQMLDAVMGPKLTKLTSIFLELVSTFLFGLRDLLNGDFYLLLAQFDEFNAKVMEFIGTLSSNPVFTYFFKSLAEGFHQGSETLKEMHKANKAADEAAMTEAEKGRVEKQAAQMEALKEAELSQTSSAEKLTDIEKTFNKFKLDNYKAEIDVIKDIEKAKLEALDNERTALDSQLAHNRISIQDYYKEQLRLIQEVNVAKQKSIDEQINKEKQLFVATEATGKITQQMAAAFDESTKKHNLPSGLLQSVANTESTFNPSAVSPAGAQGLMQIMPFNFPSLKVKDPFNIEQSVEGAAILLERLLKRYQGDIALALAAYNAGEGAVSGGYKTKSGTVIPPHEDRIPQNKETPKYVKDILEYYQKLQEHGSKLSELESTRSKNQQDSLNKILTLSDSVLDKETKQTDAIEGKLIALNKEKTAETDILNIRKNAQAAANLDLKNDPVYQQAIASENKAQQAIIEAGSRLKVEKTVADAEIKIINDVRDEKLKALETARTALDVSLSRNEIANEKYTEDAKNLIQQELAIRINALDSVNEKYKAIGIPLADFDKDRLAIIRDVKAKELAVTNAAITNSEAYQQELAKEELALFKLGHTAEEVAKKERELYFQFDKNYKAALARDKLLGTKDAPKLAANQDAIVNDKTKKADFDHLQRLIDINKSYKEIGINASEAFDIVAQGTGAVVTAFDGFIKALDNISVKLQQNSKDFKELEQNKATLGNTKYLEQYAALTEKQTALEYQKTQAGLQGAAQMLGATKHLFKEQSAGYKALEAAEKVYRAIEIANAVQSFLTKQGFLASFIAMFTASKATEATVDTAATAISVANSGVKATASGVAAVAESLTAGPPPFSFAAMAATIAALAAIGVVISGGGSTDVNISEENQKAQGAGSVLGDVSAKSESIIKALESIKDADLTMLPLTGQMARSLANIESSMSGLGPLLIRTLYTNGKIPTVDTSKQVTSGAQIAGTILTGILSGGVGLLTTFVLSKIPIIGGILKGITDFIIGGIFGTTKKSVEDYGLFIKNQTIGQIKEVGLAISQFTTIKTKFSALFGLISDTSYSDSFSPLAKEPTDQFTKIILNIVDVVGVASNLLGLKTSDFNKNINNFVLDIGKISLKGLSGQKLQDAIENIFSKAGDDIAKYIFPGLIDFQKVGEGYYETLIRVATGYEQAQSSLASLNVKAISYTAIINKQGDVFAEIAKQSIMAVEQQNGVLNSVGTIISTLQGTGQDIVDTYKELLAVRNLILATKLKPGSLTPELIQGAGGLSSLKDSLSIYNDKYFTDAEKLAAKTKEIALEFAGLGYLMPKTKDDFKKLVQGIDTSSAAGKLLLGQVLKLADAFDSLKQQQSDYLNTLKNSVSDAYDTAKNLLQKQIDVYSTFIKNMKNLSESLLTGNSTILSNPQVYQHLKGEVSKYSNLLTTGTEAQKEDARNKLPSLIQEFLDSSKKYNASGLGYVKDFMSMQSLIATSIKDATKEKDVYQKQLDQLTAQVKALGLIKDSVDNVKDAVHAVTVAINALKAFQVAQAGGTAAQKELANKAAFNSFSNQKLAAYNNAIAGGSSANTAAGANIETIETGFDPTKSKKPFSASGVFNSATGVAIGNISTMSQSGKAEEVQADLKNKTFPLIAGALSTLGFHIQKIVGGVLPPVGLKFGDSQDNGPGYMEYSIAGKKHLINSANMVEFERAFAKDMSSYLIAQMVNKDWATKLLKVDFPTVGQGLANLFQTMYKLKHPYVKPTYNPNTNYLNAINGSHKSGLTQVPFDGYVAELHKNERVLTSEEAGEYNQLSLGKKSNNANNECVEIKEELVKIRKQNAEQLQIIKNTNAIERQGFNEIIMNLKQQLNEMAATNRSNARVVRER
jgi:tape measure domain-containing protein